MDKTIDLNGIQPTTVSKLKEKMDTQAITYMNKLNDSVKIIDPIEEAYKKDVRDITKAYDDNPEEAQKHLDLAKAYYEYSIIAREKNNLEQVNAANVNPYKINEGILDQEIEGINTRETNYKDAKKEDWANVGKRAAISIAKIPGELAGYAEKGLGALAGALLLSKSVEEHFDIAGDYILDKNDKLEKALNERWNVDKFWINKYNRESAELSKNSTGFIDSSVKGFIHGIESPFTAMAESTGEMATMILTPEVKLASYATRLAKGTKFVDNLASKALLKKATTDSVMNKIAKDAASFGLKVTKGTVKLADSAASKGWIVGFMHTNEVNEEYKKITGKDLDTKTKLLYFSIDSVISGADFNLLKAGTKDVLKNAMFTGSKDTLFKQLNVLASKQPAIVKAIGLTGIAATNIVKPFTKITASVAGEYTQEFLQEWHDYNIKNGNSSFALLTGETLKEIAGNAGSAAAGAGALHVVGTTPSATVKSVLGTMSLIKDVTDYTIRKHRMTNAAKIVDNDHLSVKDEHNKIAVEALRKTNEQNRVIYDRILKSKDLTKTLDELSKEHPDKSALFQDTVKAVKASNIDEKKVATLKQSLLNHINLEGKTVEETKAFTNELKSKLEEFDVESNSDKTLEEVISPDTKQLLEHIIKKSNSKVSIEELLKEKVSESSINLIKNTVDTYAKDIDSLTNNEDLTYSFLDTLEQAAIKYNDIITSKQIESVINTPLTEKEQNEAKAHIASLLDKAVFSNNQAIVQINGLSRPIHLGRTKTGPVTVNGVKVHNNTPNTTIVHNLMKEAKDKTKELASNLSLDKLVALKESLDNTKVNETNEEQLKKVKDVVNKALDIKVDAYNTLFGKKNETLTDENIDFGDSKTGPELFKGENSLQEEANPLKQTIVKQTYAKIAEGSSKEVPNKEVFESTIEAYADTSKSEIDLENTPDIQQTAQEAVKTVINEDISLDGKKAKEVIDALKKALEVANKEPEQNRKAYFTGGALENLSNVLPEKEEAIGSNINNIEKLYDKLTGRGEIDKSLTKDNIRDTLTKKQNNLTDKEIDLLTDYITDLIANKPSMLNNLISDPLLSAFIGETKFKNSKDFYTKLTSHVNRQYQALLNNTNKTHVVDIEILKAVKGQLKSLKSLVNFLKDKDISNLKLPTEKELSLLDSNIKLLELSSKNTQVGLNDIIRQAKEVAKTIKYEFENSTKAEEDKGTAMEYTILNEKADKKTLAEIFKRLDKAGMIC